jgi:hypothetical protein
VSGSGPTSGPESSKQSEHSHDTDRSDETEQELTLSGEEASAVGDVVISYARALPEDRQQPYLALLEELETGTVTGARIPVLQQICALSLETGQARRIGLAEVETLVANVYRRTPEGRERSGEVRGVNDALSQLTGQELTSARLNFSRPGRYTLTLGVTGFDLTIVITPTGLEVQSLSAR